MLKGEKKFEDEQDQGDFHRIECSYGSIHRTTPLSAKVDLEKIKVKFKNGVLKVKMPKTESSKSRKLEIES